MSADIKDDNNQAIKEILRQQEAMLAVGPKGSMQVKRPRKSKTDKEKLEDALVRVKKKLGVEKATAMKAKWENLSTGRGGNDRSVGDGLISSMLIARAGSVLYYSGSK